MPQTPHLALPLLAAAQAQKHVTHNEALATLDALVHLSVKERGRTSPPGGPEEGERHLVGEPAIGAFAGHEGDIALFDLGAWRFLVPGPGWTAYVEAEDRVLVHDGQEWRDLGATVRELASLDRLGIGTSADDVNRLAAKLNTMLFTALGTGEGGTGDLRMVLNKEGEANVLSQLYQRGYGGRAETGLIGDDDFRIRVSADGAEWRDAIHVDRATGEVAFPFGARGLGALGNLLLNADFSVNQRVFAGGTLAQDAYGFDRWKGGPGGCTLARSGDGAITLTGTLTQVVEKPGLAGAPVTISVENPSDALAVSVADATGTITAGQGRRSVTLTVPTTATGDLSVTFSGAGVSFARPVLNRGAWREPFVPLPPGLSLLLCQRYYAKTFPAGTAPSVSAGSAGSLFSYAIVANAIPHVRWQMPVAMRAIPIMSYFNPNASNAQWSVGGVSAFVIPGTGTTEAVRIGAAGTPTIAAGMATSIHVVAEAEL